MISCVCPHAPMAPFTVLDWIACTKRRTCCLSPILRRAGVFRNQGTPWKSNHVITVWSCISYCDPTMFMAFACLASCSQACRRHRHPMGRSRHQRQRYKRWMEKQRPQGEIHTPMEDETHEAAAGSSDEPCLEIPPMDPNNFNTEDGMQRIRSAIDEMEAKLHHLHSQFEESFTCIKMNIVELRTMMGRFFQNSASATIANVGS